MRELAGATSPSLPIASTGGDAPQQRYIVFRGNRAHRRRGKRGTRSEERSRNGQRAHESKKMWLSISTGPDIPKAVRAVARYCTAPRAIHWKAALSILEYINGTSEYGITFKRGTLSSISLEEFADADYASKATDRRSVSGEVTICGGASVC